MIEDDIRETEYRDYTATMQRHLVNLIGSYLCGDKWKPMPSFLEIMHPKTDDNKPPEQTVDEAKEHIYEMFGLKPEDFNGRG